MDERVVYPGQLDLESALQVAKLTYWKNHAQWLEQELSNRRSPIPGTVVAISEGDKADPVQTRKVKEIIAEQLMVDFSEVSNEKKFIDELGADSLDTVELVMAIEDEFGIEIPDEDAEKMFTVQQVIDYVAQRTKQ